MICANIDNSIQVHIPRNKSSQSYVTQMKCQANSNTTHEVLISKEIDYKSYREICSGEPAKKVNLGYMDGDIKNSDGSDGFKIENNAIVETVDWNFAFWYPDIRWGNHSLAL